MSRARFAELELIADAIMMDRYLHVPLTKRADLLPEISASGFFSAVTDSIKQFFEDNWDPNNLAASGAAFIAHGLIGLIPFPFNLIIEVAMELLEINLKDVFVKIGDFVSDVIANKGKVNSALIDSAAGSILGGGSGNADDGIELTAEEIMAESERIFKKIGAVYARCEEFALKSEGSWARGPIRAALKMVSKSTIFGFIKKIIKFFLKGAFIAILGKLGKKGVETVAPGAAQKLREVGQGLGVGRHQTKLVPNSWGSEIKGDDWSEPVPFTAIVDTIVGWTVNIYEQLKGKEVQVKEAMDKSSKFNELLQAIRDNNANNRNQNSTYMPMKVKGMRIKSIADVVNYFILDVARQLGV